MKHTIIGMAGHIDHGKTALIRSLTGIQTDQLPQEKERGITIDIGFAYWRDDVTIIDVPGHEKFIRNMVAGVCTVDLFILVIAADDGIMPQSREHLEILKFFGVNKGIVVLNKIDLVEKDWIELVSDDINTFLSENGFIGIPIIPVSAAEGTGIDILENAIDSLITSLDTVPNDRPFRLNIDRSFLPKGYGTVVTGTVLSDSLHVNQQLHILPEKIDCRVRGLQVHQKDSETIHTGQRAAINLTGISSKAEIKRGQVLTKPGTLETCWEVFARVQSTSLYDFKIKRFADIRVHLGTAEVKARINWFAADQNFKQNTIYNIHLKLMEESVAAPEDAILLRSYSPVATIAGGKVLQINPPHLKHDDTAVSEYFDILAEGTLEDRIKLFFWYAVNKSFTSSLLKKELFEQDEKIEQVFEKLNKQKRITAFDYNEQMHFISSKQLDQAIEDIVNVLTKISGESKTARGFNQSEIEMIVKNINMTEPFFKCALQKCVHQKRLTFNGMQYFTGEGQGQEETVRIEQQIMETYMKARFTPPELDQIRSLYDLDKSQTTAIIQKLIRSDRLKSISGKYYLAEPVYSEFITYLQEYFKTNEYLEVSAVRDFTDSSRKFLIPLLEYTDLNGQTKRIGEKRTIGSKLEKLTK